MPEEEIIYKAAAISRTFQYIASVNYHFFPKATIPSNFIDILWTAK